MLVEKAFWLYLILNDILIIGIFTFIFSIVFTKINFLKKDSEEKDKRLNGIYESNRLSNNLFEDHLEHHRLDDFNTKHKIEILDREINWLMQAELNLKEIPNFESFPVEMCLFERKINCRKLLNAVLDKLNLEIVNPKKDLPDFILKEKDNKERKK